MTNKINPNEIPQELLAKAMACETVEELMALAKAEGYGITKEEAEAYLDELAVLDLSEEDMAAVAGGVGGPSKCSNLCASNK